MNYAKKFDSLQDAEAHIEALETDDVIKHLLLMVYANPEFSFKAKPHNYDNMVMENKPPKSLLEWQLPTYKNEEKKKAKKDFDDKEAKDSVRNLKHMKPAIIKAMEMPNWKLAFEEFKKNYTPELIQKIKDENDKLLDKEAKEKSKEDFIKALDENSSVADLVKAIKILARK